MSYQVRNLNHPEPEEDNPVFKNLGTAILYALEKRAKTANRSESGQTKTGEMCQRSSSKVGRFSGLLWTGQAGR